ncbi:MAG TPA: YcxB family protein [Blastocatellia bacterium]|nr:YcxB family protein [Blastocatellia bacterium]
MIVQFDATINDFVDVSIRSHAKSKTLRLWRLQGALITALLTALSVYILAPLSSLVGAAVACVSGVIVFGVGLMTAEQEFRHRLHKLYREQIGSDKFPVRVTVELLDEGLSFNQMGAWTRYEWARIERMEESDDALYFFYKDLTCSAVRKRGFESVAIKDEFLKRAEGYIQESRGPHCSKS